MSPTPGDRWVVYSADDAPEGKGGILLTNGQLEEWAGRCLGGDEIARIADAIPKSSVPEAIGEIADSIRKDEQQGRNDR